MFESNDVMVLIPTIAFIIQVFKQIPIFEQEKYKKWLPFLSMLLGIILGTLFVAPAGEYDQTIMEALIQGVIIGTSASGTYSAYNAVNSLKKPKIQEETR